MKGETWITLNSIARRLTRTWTMAKFSIIIALSALIVAIAHFTDANLGEVATFGLLLAALQALSFAKEQANTWRREAIRKIIEEVEDEYINKANKIFHMFFAAKKVSAKTGNLTDLSPTCRDEILETRKLIRKLDAINDHLKAMNIKGIDYSIEIFRQAISLSMLRDAFERHPRRYEEEITKAYESLITSFEEFRSSVINRHEKGPPGEPTEIRFINYIAEIEKIGNSYAS